MTDPQPDPQPDQSADEAELERLKERAEELMLELRARGGSFPLGPVRMESLIGFLLPDGSPERLQFELLFRTQQIAVLEQGLAAARRAMFLEGARGNGNGKLPKLR